MKIVLISFAFFLVILTMDFITKILNLIVYINHKKGKIIVEKMSPGLFYKRTGGRGGGRWCVMKSIFIIKWHHLLA